jgi:pyruvate-formate lyase
MEAQVATKPSKKSSEKKAATTEPDTKEAWRGFKPGLWQRDINVRWFLQQNYTPFDGDDSFLARASPSGLHIFDLWDPRGVDTELVSQRNRTCSQKDMNPIFSTTSDRTLS